VLGGKGNTCPCVVRAPPSNHDDGRNKQKTLYSIKIILIFVQFSF
jgi:hypothetical protein